jgi:hypothetical protein
MIVLALGACGTASKPAAQSEPKAAAPPRFVPALCEPDDQHCVLTQATGFSTEMCRCTDKRCADQVMARYATWTSAMADRITPDSKAFDHSFVQEMRKFTDCAKQTMYPGADSSEP